MSPLEEIINRIKNAASRQNREIHSSLNVLDGVAVLTVKSAIGDPKDVGVSCGEVCLGIVTQLFTFIESNNIDFNMVKMALKNGHVKTEPADQRVGGTRVLKGASS